MRPHCVPWSLRVLGLCFVLGVFPHSADSDTKIKLIEDRWEDHDPSKPLANPRAGALKKQSAPAPATGGKTLTSQAVPAKNPANPSPAPPAARTPVKKKRAAPAAPVKKERAAPAAPRKEQVSLSLQEVVRATLNNNVSIAVQEYQSRVRQEDILNQAAVFDPILSLEGRATEEDQQVASAFAAPDVLNNKRQSWKAGLNQKLVTGTEYELNYTGERDETNSSFAGLNPQFTSRVEIKLTQPLLKNFGIDINKTQIFVAQNNLEISDFEFETKVIDVITDAETIYWDLVFSRADLRVKQQSVQRARDLERRVRAQVEVGTMAPIEILQALSEVAAREEAVLLAAKLIQDNQDGLKNIMNVPFDSPEGMKEVVPLDTPRFTGGPKMDLAETIREALDHRPDYLSRKKELGNRNIQVQFNENQIYPSLDLVGTFGLNGLSGTAIPIQRFGAGTVQSRFGGNYGKSLEDTFSGNFKSWEVGLLLKYPLGNRAAKSRLSASRLEAAQLLLDLKNLEKSIVLEVRETLRQITTDVKRIQAARISRQLALEKLKAEEKKFAVGLSTSFNVLEFQTDLAEEESKELKAITDFKKSLNTMRKVTASTLKTYNIHLADRSRQP